MRLSLGTAQIGMNYGIASSHAGFTQNEVNLLIKFCRSHDITTVDTAVNYGDSEEKLGKAKISDFEIITKLPSVPDNISNVEIWARDQVLNSLERLKVSRLHGLLLHDPSQLLANIGKAILNALKKLKQEGLVKKIGISIYSPEDIDSLFNFESFDIIQAPFNIVDRRLHTSGALAKLNNHGVEVHVRSIFLQGLLIMDSQRRPDYFFKWCHLFSKWDNWIKIRQHNPLEVCIAFIKEFPEIHRCIVGVDDLKQLTVLNQIFSHSKSFIYPDISSVDTGLVNPGSWDVK